MIKFRSTTKDARPFYGLGLSHENVKRLMAGKPIVVNLADLGGYGDVVVFVGETEESMAEEVLKHFVVGDTKMEDEANDDRTNDEEG